MLEWCDQKIGSNPAVRGTPKSPRCPCGSQPPVRTWTIGLVHRGADHLGPDMVVEQRHGIPAVVP
jgi:hypothetical protein